MDTLRLTRLQGRYKDCDTASFNRNKDEKNKMHI